MTINCLIVDDEPLARSLLKEYIADTEDLVLIGELKSALEILKTVEDNVVDLIFLDINMPKLSGLDFIKNFDVKSQIIFTTAYPEFAVDAFEYNAADYLVKPISFNRFLKSIEKIRHILNSQNSFTEREWLIIKENKRIYNLKLSNILYLQAFGDYVKIITNSKSYLTKDTLSGIQSLLSKKFIKCHRSYIVNLDEIKYIEGNQIQLKDLKIPISASYKDDFLTYFT